MEEIIGNISIGILLGLVAIYFISEMGLQDENNKHQKTF